MEVVSQELVTEFTNIGLGIGFTIIDLAKKNYNNLKELKINGRILKRIAKIGVPAGLQGMVFSISNVCIDLSFT